MIVVDNKELNLSIEPGAPGWDDLSPNEQWVVRKFIELRKKDIVSLVDPRPMDTMRMAQKVPTGFDVSGTRTNPQTGVQEKWIFCKEPKIAHNGVKTYPKMPLSFFNRLELTTKKDVALIFFLLNIVDVSQFGLKVEDKAAEADKKLKEGKAESAAKYWITNKCEDKDITNLAYRWGLRGINEKSPAELRLELYDFIAAKDKQKEHKQGFQSFVDEMETGSEIVKIGAYFNEAVSNGVIAFNPISRTCFWNGTSEVIGTVIPPERFERDKEEYIIQWISRNPKEKDLFLASLNAEDIKTTVITSDDFEKITNYPKLKSWAKNTLGLSLPTSGKVDEGKERIRNHIAKSSELVQA